jgi:hypothetical protein
MRKQMLAVLLAAVLAGSLTGTGAKAAFDGGSGTAPCGTGTVTWSPAKLWPPNHKLVDVTITYDGAAFTVTGVTHDEEGLEKGSTAKHEPDSAITDGTGGGGSADPATVQLLSERLAKPKDGRTYTISVACGDPAAGGGTAALTVFVPHSRKKA